ncbi:MAG: AtpZ/AtpI family protein [Candidatus Pacebacteria bacterium]|nr:AtpZ/AtpI family protein [Candidatus Paceibacterota bacterium]MDD2757117.1 AtpZ/AtpI family protein [Candidatus Paceibacterota bacterium]MDD3283612.1 AtpZ/AtpI family protein [Candidatus Paceibacterota bacterium]MDD3969765.1 AtpZ/AtpI family protein [Candidatus Paceibacterota bacterium]MDD4737639.1 AtpZ/AtpI family protein [Candidatus Paceibacterota bacterium]
MSLPPQKNTSIGYVLGMGSGLGFVLAAPLAIAIFLGVMIDKKLETFPIALIISILIGIGLTIVNLYKIIIPFLEKRSKK